MRPIASLTLLTAVALAACAPRETDQQREARMAAASDSGAAAIRGSLEAWMRHVNAHRADSLAMLFTADGVMVPSDMAGISGHDSIQARATTMMAPGGVLSQVIQAVAVSGDLGVARGTFRYAVPAAGRTPAMTVSGTFMAHYRHEGDSWKIAAVLWNSDTPARPPAPAAR